MVIGEIDRRNGKGKRKYDFFFAFVVTTKVVTPVKSPMSAHSHSRVIAYVHTRIRSVSLTRFISFSLNSLSLSRFLFRSRTSLLFSNKIVYISFVSFVFFFPMYFFRSLISHWKNGMFCTRSSTVTVTGNHTHKHILHLHYIYLYVLSRLVSNYLSNLISVIYICTPTMCINYVQNND